MPKVIVLSLPDTTVVEVNLKNSTAFIGLKDCGNRVSSKVVVFEGTNMRPLEKNDAKDIEKLSEYSHSLLRFHKRIESKREELDALEICYAAVEELLVEAVEELTDISSIVELCSKPSFDFKSLFN